MWWLLFAAALLPLLAPLREAHAQSIVQITGYFTPYTSTGIGWVAAYCSYAMQLGGGGSNTALPGPGNNAAYCPATIANTFTPVLINTGGPLNFDLNTQTTLPHYAWGASNQALAVPSNALDYVSTLTDGYGVSNGQVVSIPQVVLLSHSTNYWSMKFMWTPAGATPPLSTSSQYSDWYIFTGSTPPWTETLTIDQTMMGGGKYPSTTTVSYQASLYLYTADPKQLTMQYGNIALTMGNFNFNPLYYYEFAITKRDNDMCFGWRAYDQHGFWAPGANEQTKCASGSDMTGGWFSSSASQYNNNNQLQFVLESSGYRFTPIPSLTFHVGAWWDMQYFPTSAPLLTDDGGGHATFPRQFPNPALYQPYPGNMHCTVNGWTGNCTVGACSTPGWYGDHCNIACPSNVIASTCNRDPLNYNNFIAGGCATGLWGLQCQHSCPYQCADCATDPSNSSQPICGHCIQDFVNTQLRCATQCSTTCVPNQCSGTGDGYTCAACQYGYYGDQCQIPCPDNCSGVCSSAADEPLGYTCGGLCVEGWVGADCSIACPPNILPGLCVLNTTSNTATTEPLVGLNGCAPNYTGDQCEIHCSPRCGGTIGDCVAVGNSFECVDGCPGTAYWGGQCQYPTCVTAAPSTRMNWNLTVDVASYGTGTSVGIPTLSCSCYNGWYDVTYGQTSQFGVVNASCNSYCNVTYGQVVQVGGGAAAPYSCRCATGVVGPTCNTLTCAAYADPVVGPCLNGGVCSDGNGASNTTCACSAQFTGPVCQYRVNLGPLALPTSLVALAPLDQSPYIELVGGAALAALQQPIQSISWASPNLPPLRGANLNSQLNPTTNPVAGVYTGNVSAIGAWHQLLSLLQGTTVSIPLLQTVTGALTLGIKEDGGYYAYPYCSVTGPTSITTVVSDSNGVPPLLAQQLAFTRCIYNATASRLTMLSYYYDQKGYWTGVLVNASATVPVAVATTGLNILFPVATDVVVFDVMAWNTTAATVPYGPGITYTTVNPCTAQPCQNGGQCTALGGAGFACDCSKTNHYTGTTCQLATCAAVTSTDGTYTTPCLQGAACVDNNGTTAWACGCPAIYPGRTCNSCFTSVNTDTSCRCLNGTYSTRSGFGPLLDLYDGCSARCTHGLVLQQPDGSFGCHCDGTYTGADCSVPIDLCNTARYPDPCPGANSVCNYTGPGTFTCDCTPGYTVGSITCTSQFIKTTSV